MDEKGYFILLNIRENEIVALTDDYDLLIRFMTAHTHTCKKCIVRQVKKKEFEENIYRYEELQLADIDNIILRFKDIDTFTSLKNDEMSSVINTIIGIDRVSKWNIKKKEIVVLEDAMKILFKYMDNGDKLINTSGIRDMCSSIYHLESIHQMNKGGK